MTGTWYIWSTAGPLATTEGVLGPCNLSVQDPVLLDYHGATDEKEGMQRLFLAQLHDHEGFTPEHEYTRLPKKSVSSCACEKMVFLFLTFCHVQSKKIGQDFFILKYGRTIVLPLWGKSSQTPKLSFQIQHLEGVLSSKEEALRHAQEAHEQTVNKVKKEKMGCCAIREGKKTKLGSMTTFKSYNPDKINRSMRLIFI